MMPEPTTTTVAAAATVAGAAVSTSALSAFGVQLGLHADVLIAGFFGSLVAMILHFLADDHADSEVRGKVAMIHERMSVMSLSALRAEVDELMAIPGQCTEPLRLLTFCVLVLKNGFTVTGESACASPENFDAEIGRNIARQNAVQKIWPLLGYELRSKLAEAN